jgi:hypothetical protein
LLREAGFSEVKIFVSHPHYAHPRCVMEMNNQNINQVFGKVYQPSSVKDAMFCFLFWVLSTAGIADLFSPHFIILGTK